jgi:hypothetical protein
MPDTLSRFPVLGAVPTRREPLLMTEDTLTKAAMSSLKIVAGAVLTVTMPVLLWVAVIEILD